MITAFNGQMQPFTSPLLLRIRNNAGVDFTSSNVSGPNIYIKIPFHNGPGDKYTVIASAAGYRDAGYIFTANSRILAEVKLLIIRNSRKFLFLDWDEFKVEYPVSAAFLGTGASDAAARSNYSALRKSNPAALACLLNLTQAMSEIDLGGVSPLSFFKEILWDNSLAQDRFFGYADPAIASALRTAASRGDFAEEKDSGKFHPGATSSWKQIAFDVANVQLTLHENDTKTIDGIACIKIEPDIDDYKNLLAHGLGEVLPNLLTGGLTDPAGVYALRWSTAEDGPGPAFDPGYSLA